MITFPLSPRPDWISETLFPFMSRFIEIDDARLHYLDEGSGPTLLFLPGSPMWSFMFRHAIATLRDRFRCIALDMPGLGLSTAPVVRGHSFERNSNYYRKFVQKLRLQDLIVIAHATAGPPALHMAIREQESITGIAITNSFAWSIRSNPPMWRFVRFVSSSPFRVLNERLNLLALLTSRIGRNTGKFTHEEKSAILGPYRSPAARRHLSSLLYGLRAETPFFERLTSDLRQLAQIPVLFLYGAKDHGYQAGFLDQWKKLLPNHSAVVLENSGHFAPEDEPETFTTELSRWLDLEVSSHLDSRRLARGE